MYKIFIRDLYLNIVNLVTKSLPLRTKPYPHRASLSQRLFNLPFYKLHLISLAIFLLNLLKIDKILRFFLLNFESILVVRIEKRIYSIEMLEILKTDFTSQVLKDYYMSTRKIKQNLFCIFQQQHILLKVKSKWIERLGNVHLTLRLWFKVRKNSWLLCLLKDWMQKNNFNLLFVFSFHEMWKF